jgi:hypothetical protein
VVDNAADILSWMKAQNVSGLFETHLVVPHVLDMFDPQPQANAQLLFNLRLNLIGDFSNGVVSRGDIEDTGD